MSVDTAKVLALGAWKCSASWRTPVPPKSKVNLDAAIRRDARDALSNRWPTSTMLWP
ncbi:hypothetical protein [Streptomyces tubercidicus]|uniref:hypothetical protein n=1 Tax=Streptomyces tubercidicus TaxID=47759 RepID=UPI0036ACEBEE